MFVDKPELIEEIMQKIPDEVSSKYTVVRSAPFYLEFLHKSVNKGAGVAALAKNLILSKKRLYA